MSETPRCGATNRQGNPCVKAAGWGTSHPGIGRCKFHGGSTPTHERAAQRTAAERAVVTYGLPREIDPHTALLEELHRTAGAVSWLQAEVAQLEPEHVTLLVEGTERGDGKLQVIDAKVNVLVDLYHRERRHFATVAKTCVDVGIEERRVQLAEQQGELLAQVLRGVLSELGVLDRPETPGIVRRHLTLIAGAAA